MNLRVTHVSKVKSQEAPNRSESELEHGDIVSVGRRETKWSTLGQDEGQVTLSGGPNR